MRPGERSWRDLRVGNARNKREKADGEAAEPCRHRCQGLDRDFFGFSASGADRRTNFALRLTHSPILVGARDLEGNCSWFRTPAFGAQLETTVEEQNRSIFS